MAQDETYEGWTNRETWAVALYINNDQGWQESVLDALRSERERLAERADERLGENDAEPMSAYYAGAIIRENVEMVLNPYDEDGRNVTDDTERALFLLQVQADIGSLWRVNWDELGASFLSDLTEEG